MNTETTPDGALSDEDLAKIAYEAWNTSGVPWESHIISGNAFRSAKWITIARAVRAALLPEVAPVDRMSYYGPTPSIRCATCGTVDGNGRTDMSTETTPDGALSDEELAKIVRQAWVAYCRETGDEKLSHLAPWETLSAWDQEADRRIARAVRAALLPDVAPLAPGETVTIRDCVQPRDTLTLDRICDDDKCMVTCRSEDAETLIALDAAGVAALAEACRRWQQAQEGDK